jgi:hypothetical protein
MKVILLDAETAARTHFTYCVMVPRTNMSPIDEVEAWAENLGIDCLIFPGSTYTKTEQDAMLFVMRWS